MKIEIPQLNKSFESSGDVNLLAKLVSEQIPIAHSCAGDGVCGTCSINIEGAELPEESEREKRLRKKQRREHEPKNCRFACLLKVPHSSKTWVLRTDYW
jgi:ferredoxin